MMGQEKEPDDYSLPGHLGVAPTFPWVIYRADGEE